MLVTLVSDMIDEVQYEKNLISTDIRLERHASVCTVVNQFENERNANEDYKIPGLKQNM